MAGIFFTIMTFVSVTYAVSEYKVFHKKLKIPTYYSLSIPKINIINANVVPVGLTATGAMGVPAGPEEVGWYNGSVRPGQIGSAVVDGHSGWKNGIPAVFDDLSKLRKGDFIYVTNNQGVVSKFIVRKISTYRPNESVPDVFSSDDGVAHLNIITCAGVWNKKTKTHSDRLVVFTDKI